MTRRVFVAASLVVATTVVAAQEPARPSEVLLAPAANFDGLSVAVYRVAGLVVTRTGRTPGLMVTLAGARLDSLKTAVWVLRRDGTAMKAIPRDPEAVLCGSNCLGCSCLAVQPFLFQNADSSEVVGLVVSVNGKLFVREIGGTPQ